MSNVGRKLIDSLLPSGTAWKVRPGGGFDKFLDGFGDGIDYAKNYLDNLSEIRNPSTTPILSDLEREFGFTTDTNVIESSRRMRLASHKYRRLRNGSIDHLQGALDAAGFDVLVHANDPAVDPAPFISKSFQMVAGGANAYAGRSDAYAGQIGGELLVNGDVIYQTFAYLMQAGGSFAYAGNANAVAGRFDGYIQNLLTYDLPTDPNDWPLVFFVGGPATRDPVTNEITAIQTGSVPAERRKEFRKIILQIKPIHSWAGLVIAYT